MEERPCFVDDEIVTDLPTRFTLATNSELVGQRPGETLKAALARLPIRADRCAQSD